MADQKGTNWKKWGLIIGAIIVVVLAILAIAFVFFFPSFFEAGPEGTPIAPQMPEIVSRLAAIFGVVIVGLIFLGALAWIVWELFFKKKELHIVKEHQKIASEAARLNPCETLGNLVLSGSSQIQAFPIGKIVGHTQIPVNFERHIRVTSAGRIDEKSSETIRDFEDRKEMAKADGRDRYDFFAFLTRKGVYAMPILSLLEAPKVFACYPSERSSDLVGDVEIYDVGTWKLSGVNLFIPGQRHREPMQTMKEIEGQLLPIAHLNLMDYIGLVGQRGIEGDTAMQKWMAARANTVNIKENAG